MYVASLAPDGDVRRVLPLDPLGGSSEQDIGSHWALAAPGDVDGDGVPDLAVGQPSNCDGGLVRGAVRILFLRADGTQRAQQVISDWRGDFEGLLLDKARFGKSLAAPGDVDLDGTPDLLVGSAQGLWLLLLTPEGRVREQRPIRDVLWLLRLQRDGTVRGW